jgi:hypothetical protein
MNPIVLFTALGAIAASSFIMRIVIGYLVRPPGARVSFRIPPINPRWIGRRLAEILYRRPPKK